MSKQQVLVIDDEAGMRHMLTMVLQRAGYEVLQAEDGRRALDLLQSKRAELVLCDVRMPGMDGTQFLREAARREIPSTIIMMSAYGSIDAAIDCMKQGAYDYISKPFKPDEVLLTLRKAEERLGLRRENAQLREKLHHRESPAPVYSSIAMGKVVELAEKLADAAAPVAISGETGTGKELIARLLHSSSARRQRPFVAVNCGAIAPTLIESELFGHVKGAFTGADRERPGLFAAAHGGTLFLDEIGELPLELQPKLLRVLQEGEIRRVGDIRPQQIDVRVVTATARNLREDVAEGCFREDLFYRLAVVEIELPPLRERREDIPLLVRHFLEEIAGRQRRQKPQMTAAAIKCLQEYGWPGNVRELQNFIEKTMIFCRGGQIDLADLPWDFRRQEREADAEYSLKTATERLEREYIRKALAATGGNRTQAAKVLEISLRGLLYKMKEYGLE
ncbi:MAG: sigma-54 dependent transcriptional regulator [Desulfuromonadales bacterium]